MRPVLKNAGPGSVPKVYVTFRGYLTDNLDYYCSYCERRLEHNIGVEHVKPKTEYGHLELEWDNLLLACVNCNSTKGHKDVVLSEYYWPHLDNTAKAFQYDTAGIVSVNAQLSARQRKRAKNMIELVGLHRLPSADLTKNPEESDTRWKFRKEAWDKAEGFKRDLQQNDTAKMRELIIKLALATGYYSVWMSVFESDLQMKQALMHAFKGTDKNCYDTFTMDYLPKGDL